MLAICKVSFLISDRRQNVIGEKNNATNMSIWLRTEAGVFTMLSEHSIKAWFLPVPHASTSVYTIYNTVFHKFDGNVNSKSLCDRHYPLFSIEKASRM